MKRKLTDLCSIQYGYAFDSDGFSPDENCPPLVRIRDVKRGYSETFYSGDYPSEYIIHSGDLLVGMDGEFNIARWKSRDALLNQRVCKITAKEGTDEEYLRFSLQKALKEIEERTAFVTVKHLSAKELNKLELDTPVFNEQERIANILCKLELIITKRENELSTLDDLIKAHFVEMFGDPFSNPMNWKRDSFKKASVRLSDGPFGSNLKSEHYSKNGVRVIRLGNIGVRNFLDTDKSFISKEHYESLKKYTCRPGEIVIGTLGDPNLRACIIPDHVGIAINKADCVHFVPKLELLNTQYACQYINCPETLLLAQGMIHGQTRSRISSGQIANMPIMIPPMELQQKFAVFVSQIDKSKSVIQKSLDETQVLFDSLMQKYFG